MRQQQCTIFPVLPDCLPVFGSQAVMVPGRLFQKPYTHLLVQRHPVGLTPGTRPCPIAPVLRAHTQLLSEVFFRGSSNVYHLRSWQQKAGSCLTALRLFPVLVEWGQQDEEEDTNSQRDLIISQRLTLSQ